MIFDNEQFADWTIMAFTGLLVWFLASTIRDIQLPGKVPMWLIKIVRANSIVIDNERYVDVGIVSMQVLGFLMFLLSFYVWVAPSHEMAVRVYGTFSIVILIVIGLLVGIIAIRNRFR